MPAPQFAMNKLRTGVIIIAIIAASAGYTYWSKYDEWVAIPEARGPLQTSLKDPSSAQFRNEQLARTGVLCGEVNAKNSMGGYVGFKRYIVAGSAVVYLEDVGTLGKPTTADIISRLDRQNAILKQHIRWRQEGVDVPHYSNEEIEKMAINRFFEDKWQDLCPTKL